MIRDQGSEIGDRTFAIACAISLSMLVALTVGCSSQPTASATLTIFAASSLTDAFGEIGPAFTADHPGIKVVFNFAGSQQLRAQLEQGAVADVFASANAKEMNAAIQAGLVIDGAQHDFVRNRLIVILPQANPGDIHSLKDLAKPGLKIVLAAPGVPAGGYAAAALDKMNAEFGATFSSTVMPNVVSYEDNVKLVVAKIQLGEGDAGIVYTSDVTPAATPKLITLEVPDKFNVTATYPIAELKAAPQSDLAAAFVAYVLSTKGQAVLQKWGFLAP